MFSFISTDENRLYFVQFQIDTTLYIFICEQHMTYLSTSTHHLERHLVVKEQTSVQKVPGSKFDSGMVWLNNSLCSPSSEWVPDSKELVKVRRREHYSYAEPKKQWIFNNNCPHVPRPTGYGTFTRNNSNFGIGNSIGKHGLKLCGSLLDLWISTSRSCVALLQFSRPDFFCTNE